MRIFKNLFQLRHHQAVEESVLEELFVLERNTLVSLILLETIVLYILMPLIGNGIAFWYGLIVTITLWRFYDAYDFKSHRERHSSLMWHKKFVIKVWITAFLLSALALFVVPQLNEYYQLFVFIMLIGISIGAIKTLSGDYRTAIGYLLILLVPTSMEMLLLMRHDTYILAFLMILYFYTQTSIILHAYEKNRDLKQKEVQIDEVQTELNQQQETLELFFKQAPIGILSYDNHFNIIDCNQALLELFDQTRDNIIGMNLKLLPDDRAVTAIEKALENEVKNYVGPYRSIKGKEYWIEARLSPIYDKNNVIGGGVVLIEDKTKEHTALNELKYLASHDPLTSLCNRRGFSEFMEEMVREEKHKIHYSVLIYLDLDRFKYINDSLGHLFGDALLAEIAKRLRLIADPSVNLTRLGGDEFAIVLPFAGTTKEEARQRADTCIKKVQHCFNETFIINDIHLNVKTSIGIVLIEPAFDNIQEIVRHADISMYQAKKHGEEHVSYYNIQMDLARKKNVELQRNLVSALTNGELELYFQPIVHIKDNSVHAAEALIRWDHLEEGLLLPKDFIPLAIESDIMADLGWWVLNETCRCIAEWKKREDWCIEYVSINFNAEQLIKNNFMKTFLSTLNQYGILNSEIKLEVPESSLINNFEITRQIISELQGKGIKCAIDNFGVGYASLSYLKKLSFSVLKIDREFILEIEHNREHVTLIKSIVEIGKEFNYDIVVEGIESTSQKEIIRQIDNSLSYQGFLVSPPIPSQLFEERFMACKKTNL